jgi:hypothetical protein
MPAPKDCSSCGKPLPVDHPSFLCPDCTLKVGAHTTSQQAESPYEWLALIGVLIGGLAVAFGIVMIRSGWVALGLLAVERLASAFDWRASRRSLVAQALALGAIAASIAILAVDFDHWWLLILIWFWYGERIRHFVMSPRSADVQTSDIVGLTERERRVVAAIQRFGDETDFSIFPRIDPDQQQDVRSACEVPAEERILALKTWNLSGDEACSIAITSTSVCWCRVHGKTEERRAIPFGEISNQTFAGHGQSISPTMEANDECSEVLRRLLNALKAVV